jgi:N-acetylmuramoyl-L-alanine amidase
MHAQNDTLPIALQEPRATLIPMKFLAAAWIVASLATATVADAAANWRLIRHEGRDYVTLDNLAEFYGFPPPAPLPVIPAAHSTTAGSSSSASTPANNNANSQADHPAKTEGATASAPPSETTSTAAPPPVLPKSVALTSDKWQIEVTLNSREVMINGVKQWLAFPAVVQDTKVLISRLDLSKIIEPRLRPEMIQGFTPVSTIVLDAGHGGHDKGAISKYGYEKDFALDVALRARKLLEARGYKVAMTRTTDVFVPLHDRPRLAQSIPDSIFVSIHFNASPVNNAARGFEIFSIAPRGAPATNDAIFSMRDMREEPGNAHELQSSALAASIYHSLLGQVPTIDRGLKHARFAVLRLATVPAVLIECGFVSNGPESSLIGSPPWRERVAEAVVEGIGEYKSLAELKQRPKAIAEYRRNASSGATQELSSPPTGGSPTTQ